jgi:putative membrane protein
MPGLLNFLAYFGASVALWGASVALYVQLTPYHEVALIKQGNTAAAWSLAGTVLGLALPLASLAAHAVSLADLALWAGVGLAAQLLLWLVASLTLLRGLKGAIEANQASVGMLLGALSAGVGALNAGCLTY